MKKQTDNLIEEKSKRLTPEKTKDKNTKFKKIDYSKKKSWFDFKGIVRELKFNKKTDNAFLVDMKHRNGSRSSMIMFPENNASFVWNKRRYIIEEDKKFYDNTTRNWALHFHEDLSIPYELDIKVQKKKNEISSYEVSTAINPDNLETYMKSSFVEKIMRGEEMDALFKKIIVIATVSAVAGVITLFLVAKMSGILDSLGI